LGKDLSFSSPPGEWAFLPFKDRLWRMAGLPGNDIFFPLAYFVRFWPMASKSVFPEIVSWGLSASFFFSLSFGEVREVFSFPVISFFPGPFTCHLVRSARRSGTPASLPPSGPLKAASLLLFLFCAALFHCPRKPRTFPPLWSPADSFFSSSSLEFLLLLPPFSGCFRPAGGFPPFRLTSFFLLFFFSAPLSLAEKNLRTTGVPFFSFPFCRSPPFSFLFFSPFPGAWNLNTRGVVRLFQWQFPFLFFGCLEVGFPFFPFLLIFSSRDLLADLAWEPLFAFLGQSSPPPPSPRFFSGCRNCSGLFGVFFMGVVKFSSFFLFAAFVRVEMRSPFSFR